MSTSAQPSQHSEPNTVPPPKDTLRVNTPNADQRPADTTTEPIDLDSNESSEIETHSDESSAESEDSQQSDDDNEWDFDDAWDDSNIDSLSKPQQEVDASNLELLLFQQQVLRIKSKKNAPPLLPFEILVEISKYLPSLKDHKSFMMVSHRHLSALFPRLYKTPILTSPTTLSLFIRTVKESIYYETRHYMNSVKCLHLGELAISDDHLFDIINRCKHLESLTVHAPDFSTTSLCSLALASLDKLDISGCGQVEIGVWATASLTAGLVMTSLNLSRTKLLDADIPQLLDHLPQLQNLSLTACSRLTNHTACHIAIHNQRLVSLTLDECYISDQGVTALCCGVHSKLHGSLRMLYLNRTSISVTGFQTVLCSLTQLELFSASGCDLMCNYPIQDNEFVEPYPQWRKVAAVEARDEVTNGTPAYPGIQFHQTRLNVPDAETLALVSISVSGEAVLDSHLMALKFARGLTCVTLVRCRVTHPFVGELLSRLEKLKTIYIDDCWDLRLNEVLSHITRSASRFTLEHLTMTPERQSLRNLFRLVQHCPRLQSLSVEHMNRKRSSLSERDLQAMRKYRVISDAVEEDALEEYLQSRLREQEWRRRIG
ncbi:hypothetical protein HDU98_003074 [Podochytrium sp. JEL0797]|nr:hypothetical protein HDU98_003074 [Podochytrium sp. JEL0797]